MQIKTKTPRNTQRRILKPKTTMYDGDRFMMP